MNSEAKTRALEQQCEKLAKEMGIVLSAATPSKSWIYGLTGLQGIDVLEYWVAADYSEHLRAGTTNVDAPYVQVSGTANAEHYRLNVIVPPKSLGRFTCPPAVNKGVSGTVRERIDKRIIDMTSYKGVLPESDAMFTVWIRPQELEQVTADFVRAYVLQ